MATKVGYEMAEMMKDMYATAADAFGDEGKIRRHFREESIDKFQNDPRM